MQDVLGKALQDFYLKKAKNKLYVHDNFGPKVEMPTSLYFRNLQGMPSIEKKALQLCRGTILDIGAGAGSHTLELQKNHKEASALEISPLACAVMQLRGVTNVINEDFFRFCGGKFDTLLLLMNGIGLCGNIEGFKQFLEKATDLLHPQGRIIFDSCDISYMYEDTEMPKNQYYGEVTCRYEYRKEFTDWFRWLYIDKNVMRKMATESGWKSEIILEDHTNQYLAVLTRL